MRRTLVGNSGNKKECAEPRWGGTHFLFWEEIRVQRQGTQELVGLVMLILVSLLFF
jgi:hypothetical protein